MVDIQNRTGRPLPTHIEKVMQAMFRDYRELVVKSEFSGGFSGSRVFLVRPIAASGPELPSVVKIDRVPAIEREWRAYQDCIRHRLPGVAEVRGEPTFPPGSPYGGLWYPLAGAGTFEVTSLHAYCREAAVTDIHYVLQDRLIKSMATLWQQAYVRPEFHLQSYYDSFLPVNLVIDSVPQPPTAAVHWLHPTTIHNHTARPGDHVLLSGFVVDRLSPEQQRLTLDIPAEQPGAYRLHLCAIPDISTFEIGQVVHQPLAGVIRQTRHDQLLAQAQAAVGPGVDLTADTLALPPGTRLPNPLTRLPAVLNKSFDARVGYIHGDLNLENVLVEPDNRNVFLIDFAKSRQDHVLRDLLHLEAAVVTRLLPEALVQVMLSPEMIVPFYERLHCAVTQPGSAAPPAGLEKPFAILESIRQAAGRFLFQPGNWVEYYDGLTLYLLGSLKFADLDGLPTAPRPKQLAFWGAAMAQQLALEPPPCAPAPQVKQAGREESGRSPAPINQTNFYAPISGPIHTGSGHINYPSSTQSRPSEAAVNRAQLRQLIIAAFNEGEMRTLCADLGIDYEGLPGGSGKEDKARELIAYCERRGRLGELVEACRGLRPHVSW